MATSTTSAYNTPQAQDDSYSYAEAQIEAALNHILWLDVMANDLGGKAKTLWSIDNGDVLADLFQQDAQISFESSALGATIYIKDGKIAYDLTPIMGQVNGLSAGDALTDTLTYSIRLGNGTLSFGSVQLHLYGTNDGVTLSPNAAGTVAEDSSDPTLSVSGTTQFGDVDLNDTHSASATANAGNVLGGTLTATVTQDATGTGNGTVTWAYHVDNSATQYLAAGDSVTEYFTVMVADNHGSSATQQIAVTVTGTDDLSVVSGAISGAVVEDAAVSHVGGTLNALDVDGPDNSFVAASAAAAHGSYSVDATGNWLYTLNNGDAAVNALAAGDSLSDSFDVVTSDGVHQLVSISIAGADDLAVVSGDVSGAVVEDAAVNHVGGKLNALDVDGPDNSFVAASAAAAHGSYSVDATGNWLYTLDNSDAAVNALHTGESLSDSFTVVTSDGVAQQVSISIGGHTEFLPPVYDGADPNDFDALLGAGAGVLNGTSGNDTFDQPVNGGADTINGLGGDDRFFTYAGTDTVYAGSGNDIIETGGGIDTVYGQAGNDVAYGENNPDALYGGSGNDDIQGGAGDDVLFGGSGNDTITGGGGNDVITGGYGADTFNFSISGGQDKFVYLDERDTGDVFNDFHSGFIVDFSAIDADKNVAGNQAFAWGGTIATAHGIWASVDANHDGHIYLDTDGDISTAELTLTLLQVNALSMVMPTQSNFIF